MPASTNSSSICQPSVHPLPGLIGLTTLIMLVSGCVTVGPDYKTPEAPMSQQWIDIDAPRVNNQAADYSQWWTVFNDPVLDSLIDTAYQQNLTLRIAGLRILEARANLGIAVGSKYPQTQQVNGNAAKVVISDNEAGSRFADRRFESAEGTRLLGTVSPPDRVGGRAAGRLDRRLR